MAWKLFFQCKKTFFNKLIQKSVQGQNLWSIKLRDTIQNIEDGVVDFDDINKEEEEKKGESKTKSEDITLS